jgi:hypothetical protein
MLEELQRRHYSQATTQRYIRFVERFAQHFHSSPDRLGRQHIREYQAQLFTVQKLSPGTVTNPLCALRFFYIQTLKKPWSIADTPYPKKRNRLPTILSQEEVAQLIDAALTPFHANRRRSTLLPLCRQLLGAVPQPQIEPAVSAAKQPCPLWLCPNCGAPMIVVERFTAAQILLRSPPIRLTAAA